MLQGTLELWLDELERSVLHRGNSFWFESSHGVALDRHQDAGLASFSNTSLFRRLSILLHREDI
jgi:hypothetical protein